MAKLRIEDLLLYRWRYYVGFAVIGILLVSLIAVVTFLSPGGVSKAEMNSVVASTFTPPETLLGKSPENILDLPYRLFQKLSLAALDVTLIGIKLPSIVMAIGSILAFYGLLRLWFRRNVAIITSIITLVTGQFMLLAQLGTPAIGYIFWNIAILYSVSMLAQTEKYRVAWLVLSTIFAALSLYSPLQVYVVVALIATSIIQPHARFVVWSLNKVILAACFTLFLVLTLPLTLSAIAKPSIVLGILGISPEHLIPNLHVIKTQVLQYFGFISPGSGVAIRPAYGLGIVLIALIGLYRLFTAKYTAKSYILTVWAILLMPVIALKPEMVMITFVPVILLVGHGVDYLIGSWYRLFPNNPYARVFGLVPLSVLLFGLVFSGVERFVYGYHYDPRASNIFTTDLKLIDSVVDSNPGKEISLVVAPDQRKFYTVYSDRKVHTPHVRVLDSVPQVPGDVLLIHREAVVTRPANPSTILVNRVSNDADRFYLYKIGTN